MSAIACSRSEMTLFMWQSWTAVPEMQREKTGCDGLHFHRAKGRTAFRYIVFECQELASRGPHGSWSYEKPSASQSLSGGFYVWGLCTVLSLRTALLSVPISLICVVRLRFFFPAQEQSVRAHSSVS